MYICKLRQIQDLNVDKNAFSYIDISEHYFTTRR